MTSDILSRSLSSPLNFTFSKGQTYLITGASGTGKTTLLNMILGFETEYRGEILFDGLPVKEFSQYVLGQRIAYHSSNSQFIRGSLKENFHLHGIYDFDSIHTMMQLSANQIELNQINFEMLDADALPFSTGEKQKLLLMMAIYQNPDVLILDESTANLNEQDAIQLLQRIRQQLPDMIIIMATHQQKLAQITDHCIQLSKQPQQNIRINL